VAEEVQKKLPGVTPILFTADSVKTHAAAVRVIAQFKNTKGAVLVGTERMLPYLEHVSLSVVASIDSVLSLGSWRADEHAMSTLYGLLEKTNEKLIIETRQPTSRVVQSVATGSPIEYLRDEVRDRKTYEYPPFSTFVGLEWRGTEVECKTLADMVKESFKNFDLVGPLPPEAAEKGKFVERAVVRTTPESWPEPELELVLRSLPPTIGITVDPDDIV
jgi:primosomal protein N' (replication factor Y)